MKDIFNDASFERFLVGGVKDLDEGIGQLVYEVYRKKLVETIWSCSGHIGDIIDGNTSTRPQTHFVYNCGKFFYKVLPERNSELFSLSLKREVSECAFARIYPYEGSERLVLEMRDIEDMAGRQKWEYGEVPIELARKRLGEFKQFWSRLTDVARTFNK